MTDNLPALRYRGELLPHPLCDHNPALRAYQARSAVTMLYQECVKRMTIAMAEVGKAMNQWIISMKPVFQELTEIVNAIQRAMRDEEMEEWEGEDGYRWRPEVADELMLEIKSLGC